MSDLEAELQARRKTKAIPNSEWVVSIQLEIDGQPQGLPLRLAYADSYLAAQPKNVGYLIAAAMNERANVVKPSKRKKK